MRHVLFIFTMHRSAKRPGNKEEQGYSGLEAQKMSAEVGAPYVLLVVKVKPVSSTVPLCPRSYNLMRSALHGLLCQHLDNTGFGWRQESHPALFWYTPISLMTQSIKKP